MTYKDDCLKPKRPCSGCPDEVQIPVIHRKRPCPPVIPPCACKPRCDEPVVFIRTQIVPASMGTSEPGQPYAPKNGTFYNTLVRYEADGAVFIYDSAGIYTPIANVVLSVNDKTGKVVLTTEDIENVSGYINADEAQALINAGIATVTEDLTAETEARIQGDATLQQEIDDIKNSPDVVDIVATYADLQAYDTSSLGDKDIIRVLRDETHSGASTYYRWNASTSSFTFIGEVGDYYTKDQTDGLLANKVDKVTGKGLSENDFTDGDKTKLDGIEAGAEVNEIDSISVNGATVVPDVNKNVDLDIPDSAFVGTDGTAAGTMGLVPAPATTDAGKYLKADGSWSVIPDEILENAGAPTTSTVGVKGQLLIDTTNAKLYQCTAVDNTDPQNPAYTWTEVGGSSVNVVQTTGTSTTDVMSQNAVTRMVFNDSDWQRKVRIGSGCEATLEGNVAIGFDCKTGVADKYGGIAIGKGSRATGYKSIAIGGGAGGTDYASATANETLALFSGKTSYAGGITFGSAIAQKGVMDIRTVSTSSGYNNSNYRLVSGLYDPQSNHDAATKGYVDTAVASAGADAFTTNEWNALWA